MRLHDRLDRIRGSSAEALAPLWIEALPPEEALAELKSREGPVFRLQEARFLQLLGRADEARRTLESLEALPPGLARLRDRLLSGTGADRPKPEPLGPEPPASRKLAELYASQGDRAAAADVYRRFLDQHPGHEAARARLRELEEGPVEPALAALQAWLGRVRQWRRVLGV